jgi:hypothetical protein
MPKLALLLHRRLGILRRFWPIYSVPNEQGSAPMISNLNQADRARKAKALYQIGRPMTV